MIVNNDFEIKFYEAEQNGAVEQTTTSATISASAGYNYGLIISIKSFNKIYQTNFEKLELKIKEALNNQRVLSLYQLNSLEFPRFLLSSIDTLEQKTKVYTTTKYRTINVGPYIKEANRTYYFLVFSETFDMMDRYTMSLDVSSLELKTDELVNYKCKIPKYLKYDYNLYCNSKQKLNLYNGKLSISQPLASVQFVNKPLELDIIYNQYDSDPNYKNLNDADYEQFSNIWLFNYSQKIKKHKRYDRYLYINSYGEQIYLNKASKMENIYVNKEGKGIVLIKNTTNYVLQDVVGNKLVFNLDGYLSYIESNNTVITLEYSSSLPKK